MIFVNQYAHQLYQTWCVNVGKQLTNILICFQDAPGHFQKKRVTAQDVTNLHHI
jgi:hypothetical protein